MDKKGIRAIWYTMAAVFFLLSAFTDIPFIFPVLAAGCIYTGNIRTKQL